MLCDAKLDRVYNCLGPLSRSPLNMSFAVPGRAAAVAETPDS